MSKNRITWRRIVRDGLVLLGILAAVVYWWYLTTTGGEQANIKAAAESTASQAPRILKGGPPGRDGFVHAARRRRERSMDLRSEHREALRESRHGDRANSAIRVIFG